ncbi:uncharacterized protein LOC128206831 [Mya arenaria]|uniref:uncharacterized protein LOC128206831 n=1 Tax=Mya arenaria TaxID=6604 RepID=UPI0022E2C44C|nr:uncharacterized protein LOC128206831 [Mya arenaria]
MDIKAVVTCSFMLMCLKTVLGNYEGYNSGEKRPCQSNAHVCTSLMRYADGTEVNEGPYCLCDGCGEKWVSDDLMSLSWPHYERADRTVQYRFCVPILPQRECDPGDLAVTMGTSTSEWSPHVREARCSCPENTYQLLGWWRHPTSKHNNRTGQWIYEYFCEKPQCERDNALCAKIYVDRYSGDTDQKDHMVIGYNFLCACSQGFKCPDRDDEDDKELLESDHRGIYVARYCQETHSYFKR